ncbi:SpoIIE family protein phosphatase [Nonomuraea sp. NPDC050663]|uniref:SpoIIE family protein phosphatase n=1 Tax=Nonomuraea sp. NPDC050663 TaxID=3364370 RepID=UPI0037985C53
MDGARVAEMTLSERISALKAVSHLDPAQTPQLLRAALLELEHASEELASYRDEIAASSRSGHHHLRSLCALLDQMPLPIFILDRNGAIVRTNRSAGQPFGRRKQQLQGKPFAILVDLPHRPVFRSHLGAVLRGLPRLPLATRLCLDGQAVEADLTLINLVAEEQVAVTVSLPGGDVATARPLPDGRLDVITELTTVLLSDRECNEGWLLRRSAEVLTAAYADLAVIDRDRADGARHRAAVVGDPGELDSIGLLESLPPLETRYSTLLNPIDDELALGRDKSGLPALTLLRAGSAVIVPVGDETGMDGTLTLIRRSDRPGFDTDDLRLAERIGRHLALAVRADRVRRARTSSAHALQASLLPRRLPEVPGCELSSLYTPAGEGELVGGDFYDVFPCRGGWGLVLGDVCGKGDEAAAITAIARNGLRVLAGRTGDPAQLLHEINQALIRHPDTERFVTAIVAHVERVSGGMAVRLASAGHPPALVRGADGVVRQAEGGGLPLGLFDDALYPCHEIKLAYGEALIVYSDGVTEARDEFGHLYGPQRLSTALAAAPGFTADDLIHAVHEDLRRFATKGGGDDTALLVLRVDDEPEF